MKLLLGLLFLSHTILMASDDDDYVYKKPDPIQLPRSLKKMGLPVPRYNPHIPDQGEENPILGYDLSPSNIEVMRAQYEVAKKAEKAGHNELALKIYWSLAEQGYGEANRRLTTVFNKGELGLSRNEELFSFFLHRPPTVREMVSKQRTVRYFLDAARKAEAEEKDRLAASPPGAGDVVEIYLDDKEESKLLGNGSRHGLKHRAGKK